MSETKFETHTGGCLCGAVRYEGGELLGAGYCHCRLCQRALGNVFFAFVQFPRDSFLITRGEPRWFQSSKPMERGFCAECGAPLFTRYQIGEFSDWIGVTIGSLDAPEAVTPQGHFGTESMLPWLEIADDLPRGSYPENFIEKYLADDHANTGRRSTGLRFGESQD